MGNVRKVWVTKVRNKEGLIVEFNYENEPNKKSIITIGQARGLIFDLEATIKRVYKQRRKEDAS